MEQPVLASSLLDPCSELSLRDRRIMERFGLEETSKVHLAHPLLQWAEFKLKQQKFRLDIRKNFVLISNLNLLSFSLEPTGPCKKDYIFVQPFQKVVEVSWKLSPYGHLSYLNMQWLDNLFPFLGIICDLHEFGWKLLLMMNLSWHLLNRPQSRLELPCCREENHLLLTRNRHQGQGGVTLKTKPLSSCLHFLSG